MNPQFGKFIVAAGLVLVIVGLLVKFNLLGWFGKLPGDIRIERENMRFYFPLASCVLISVVLSAAAWLIRRFWS